ncbi:hypothetical protein Tco_0901511 [Tanacetum coccineum]
MSQHSHWIDLHDVRKLSSKLKAKLMGKRFKEKKVADNIVEEAIVGDTIVCDNFDISNKNVVAESVVVPKANVGVEIIIVSDDDGDDDNEVVGDTMDTVVAETDDEIDSAVVGMSGFILEVCVDAMEGGSLEEKAVQQASLEGNMENQLSNVKQSGIVGRHHFIQTRKSQRIQNQKTPEMDCEGSKPEANSLEFLLFLIVHSFGCLNVVHNNTSLFLCIDLKEVSSSYGRVVVHKLHFKLPLRYGPAFC